MIKFSLESLMSNGGAVLAKSHQWEEMLIHMVFNKKMNGESRPRKLVFEP